MSWRPRSKRPPEDYFGNLIEVGDRFFYSTCAVGTVVNIKVTSIEIEIRRGAHSGSNHIMKCKSPERGICLDKIPKCETYED
ncbi:MAG: hypothetical protein V3T23_07525 [Nitrososphaerales archaeon]